MMRTPIFAFALAAGLVVASTDGHAVAAEQLQTTALMARTRQYLVTFVERFSNVVTEERYVQEQKTQRRRRELKSDFYLVSPPGAPGWLQLRDVFEVDGTPVRDRQERLTTLILRDPGTDWAKRAFEFGRESTRYNLADIGSFNVPLNVLAFLQPEFQDHFQFLPGAIDRKVSDVARLIRFQEKGVRLYAGRPLHGRVWIDDRTGAVLKTELLIGNAIFPNQIITTFTFDPDLQVNVPTEMREWYGLGASDMTGLATYGRFRKFGVTSEEHFREPAGVRSPGP